MTLQEFKNLIENKTIDDSSYIFCADESFCCYQYIHEISKIKGKNILSIDTLDFFINKNPFVVYNDIYVYEINKLDTLNIELNTIKNLYIICKETIFDCIKFNTLEKWQIKDFVFSNLSLNEQNKNWLCEKCNYDIYRLQNEIDRIKIFKNQDIIFNSFINDGIYLDIENDTIFSFTNAIENKDYITLCRLYANIDYSNIDALGLTSILYNAFKKFLIIKTTPNASSCTTGISEKQFWALYKLSKLYSITQLINILKFLSKIQDELSNGLLSESILLDYVILNVLQIGRN